MPSFIVAGHPDDERLRRAVAPPDWVNPRPRKGYDMVVLGGGAAGLVVALGSAGLGARVALVERGWLGGDCLNTGCVPSKVVLHETGEATETMARMRRRRADLGSHDAAERVRRAGVDLFYGTPRFLAPDRVAVDALELRFKRACLATGGRPRRPELPGLTGVEVYDSDSLWSLEKPQGDWLVVGGGPIGAELAWALAAMGCRVTVAARSGLLPREDPDVGELLTRRFAERSIRVVPGPLGACADQTVQLGDASHWRGQSLLVAVGRQPNLETLSLDRANVEVVAGRLRTDAGLATTNPRIYAAGDVVGGPLFTHAAEAMARVVVANSLFFARRRFDPDAIPWCTFTDPEVAHLGVNSRQAREASMETFEVGLEEVDRAVCEGRTDGFFRVHTDRRGRIRGATLVAPGAGELIGQLALARQHGLALDSLAELVVPYPSLAVGLKRLGQTRQRRRLRPWLQAVLRVWMRLFR